MRGEAEALVHEPPRAPLLDTLVARSKSRSMMLAEEIAAYQRDGFIVRRSVFAPDEIAHLASECDTIARRDDLLHPENMRCRFQPHVDSGELLLEAVDPIVDLSPAIARIARDERL